jgi:carboxylesterase type B
VANGNATWMYWFTWATPAFGGIFGSCHAVDVPFVFHNLDRPGVPAFTGDGDDRARVAEEVAGAVLQFASDGKPEIRVALATAFKKFHFVNVIGNLRKEEQQHLEKQFQ